MALFTGSKNFATTGGAAGYRLDVSVTTTEVSGGTELFVTASATRIRFDLTPAFSSSGSRSYNVPGGRTNSTGGNLLESGSATWSYDFNNGNTQTVWGGFYRYIPYSYGTSTTVTITAAGSGSSFLLSTSVAVPVTLFDPSVTVPNIIGLDFSSANAVLINAGLVPSGSSTNTSNASLANQVYAQSPQGGSSVASGSTVFYNYYNYVAPQYTVTYNGNGGTPARSSDTVTYPNSVTLPSASRSNYTFAGWFTSPSGGSYVGTTGNSYTPSSNITLYALWSPIQYTISFEENGGNAVANITGNVNSTVSLPTSSQISRSGYTFAGWFSNASLTVGPYTSWTITGNQTLYAKWDLTPPTFSDENISQSLLLNQDISSAPDSSVSATNAVSYSIVYSGTNQNPTSWLTIDNSGNLSGSTNVVGTYGFFVRATNAEGDPTDSNAKTITVSYPGSRFNATVTEANIVNAKRRDQFGNWISITSMKRFDGTNWLDITN